MGIENMRRWPMYIIFAVTILLTLSLLNSWSMETELQNRLSQVSTQLQECSRQQSLCMEESLRYQQQRDIYNTKVNDLESSKIKMTNDISDYKTKVVKTEMQVNRTLVDVELCKTELQSLKNLQMSKSATLETLRLEKETLTTQLEERKKRIDELEKEIAKLKISMTTKSAPNPSASSRVTPAAQPPKLSPALNANIPMNEPVIENNAKEEMEDPSALNDDNFEQQ
ncbi:SRC kinase signaling inhibitor 1-like [Bicyclus anynana]|uniref:SRC kinase signaling inhibitor 1-like n=1 Tax=Bicyclus anynana TaxID=110368 RepID=A0A6J1NQ38_BICAN|nr:SRC kinase signaling inhibitor 1-like [Bicyclus anynana]